MVSCSLSNCNVTKADNPNNYTFHRYPRNAQMFEKWARIANRKNWSPNVTSVICSKHFEQKCFMQRKCRRVLLKGSIPTLFIPIKLPQSRPVSSYVYRDIIPPTIPPTITDTPKVSSGIQSPGKKIIAKNIRLIQKIKEKNRMIKSLKAKVERMSKRILSLEEDVHESELHHRTEVENLFRVPRTKMEIDTVEGGDYFSSYEDLEVHKLMLEDEPRTEAYKNAILNNQVIFKDKVVMDVGCGTGILSIFCAQAGAKKVYAVEASNMALLAKKIVKENKFEAIIEVIHSKVEDVVLPNYSRVDVIVSEWMGFYLLHEGMLDSVLMAREKFLKDDGYMFPETAAVYVAPCSVPSIFQKWDRMYGVQMKSFAEELRTSKGSKPEILTVQQEDLLGPEVILCWLDMKETTLDDLESFSIQHVVGANRNGRYQGLCIWFECRFPNSSDNYRESVILDTSPTSAPTHWKQTVIVFPDEQEVEEGEPIAFQLDMNRDQMNGRRYNLLMTMLDSEAVDHPRPCTCHMTKCILIKEFIKQNTGNVLSQHNKGTTSNVLKDEPIDDDDDCDDDS